MNRPHALRLGVNRCLKTVRLSTEKPLVTNPDAFPGHRLARWLAHPADPQRATFQTAVLALVIYVALAVLQQFQVNAGMVEQGAATRQTVFCRSRCRRSRASRTDCSAMPSSNTPASET